MPTNETRIYWDTCVCLSYIEEWEERWPAIERLAVAASTGRVRIVTSAWTVAEVAYVEAEKLLVEAPDGEQRIRDFWDSGIVEVHELHRFIADQSRNISRMSRFGKWGTVKPKDAVHLATAEYLEAVAFHTYDRPLITAATGKLGFDISEPNELYVPAAKSRPRRPTSGQQPLLADLEGD